MIGVGIRKRTPIERSHTTRVTISSIALEEDRDKVPRLPM